MNPERKVAMRPYYDVGGLYCLYLPFCAVLLSSGHARSVLIPDFSVEVLPPVQKHMLPSHYNVTLRCGNNVVMSVSRTSNLSGCIFSL